MKKSFVVFIFLCALAAMLLGCAGGTSSAVEQQSGPTDTQLMQESFEQQGSAISESTQESYEELDQSGQEQTEDLDGATESDEAKTLPSPEQGVLASQLTSDITPLIEASGMQVGVCVINLKTHERVSIGGATQIPAASMIKLLIAGAFLKDVDAGLYSLDDYYSIQAGDIVGGTGVLAGLGAGAEVSYREILEKMIYVSDNTGANILINCVGMDKVNAFASSLELSATSLNRYMMDEAAIAAGIDNFTSADDTASLLEQIYNRTLVSADSSEIILGALELQQDNTAIPMGLPAGVDFAHKTGTLGYARHDGGIVEGDTPFVISVMCAGDAFSESGANSLMAQIASVAYSDIAGQ